MIPVCLLAVSLERVQELAALVDWLSICILFCTFLRCWYCMKAMASAPSLCSVDNDASEDNGDIVASCDKFDDCVSVQTRWRYAKSGKSLKGYILFR